MALSKREICCRMVGVTHARKCNSFDVVLVRVQALYPNAHREGAAGGWSWTQDGEIVAASVAILTIPYGKHWLAIKPRREK